MQALPGSAPENGPKSPIRITDGNKKINVGTKLDEKNPPKTGSFAAKTPAGIWSFSNGKALPSPSRNVSPNVVQSRLAKLMKSIGLITKDQSSKSSSKSGLTKLSTSTKAKTLDEERPPKGPPRGPPMPVSMRSSNTKQGGGSKISIASSYDEQMPGRGPGVKVTSYKMVSVASGPDEKNGAKRTSSSFSSMSSSSMSSNGVSFGKSSITKFSGPDEKDGRKSGPKSIANSNVSRTGSSFSSMTQSSSSMSSNAVSSGKSSITKFSGPDEKDGRKSAAKSLANSNVSNLKSATVQSSPLTQAIPRRFSGPDEKDGKKTVVKTNQGLPKSSKTSYKANTASTSSSSSRSIDSNNIFWTR